MDELKVTFRWAKDTKNAKQFQEVVAEGRERGVVGSIYVLKSDLDAIGNPHELEVTIKPA